MTQLFTELFNNMYNGCINIRGVVCTLILCSFLIACSDNNTAQSHIAQADQNIKDNKRNEAIIELKNAIKLEPQNASARYSLGKLYLSLGDGEGAAKELDRAYRLGYASNKVLPLLARAYFLLGSNTEIISLELASKKLNNEIQSQYLAYLTIAFIRIGDAIKAQASSILASEISPSSEYSLLASAYIEVENDNLAKASAQASRALIINPDNPDALMLQGQIAAAEGNHLKALLSFEHYAKVQPKAGKVQLFIADSLLKTEQFDKAEIIADNILSSMPNQPFANAIKATVCFEKQDYQAAITHSEQAFNAGYSTSRLKLIAGASAFYLKNYEQSHLHLNNLVNHLSQEHPARRMLAISQLALGLIDELSDTLGEFKSNNAEEFQFLTSLSFELLEIGAVDDAREIAVKATYDSNNAEQNARRGILKLMMNNPSGLDDLERALKINPELREAELALAFSSVQRGELIRANAIAKKWQEKFPDKAGGFNLQAAIFFKENKLEKAKVELLNSLTKEPKNVFALVELAKLASYQKNSEKSAEYSELAVNTHPLNVRALRFYFYHNDKEKGVALIKAAYEHKPTDQNISLLYVEALIKLERYTKASELLNNHILSNKTPKRYWQLVLFIQNQLSENDNNYDTLLKWLKNNPYHIEPAILLAEYWLNNNDINHAISVINQSLKYNKNNAKLLFVKIDILIRDKRGIEANALYPQINKLSIKESAKKSLKGRLLLLDQNYADAVNIFNGLYSEEPSRKNVLNLAVALKGGNQKDKAIATLEAYLKTNPEDSQSRNVLANFYLEGKHALALKQYQLVIENQPNNVIVLNNLAWLTMESDQLDEALKFAEKAYKLAPTIANIVDTYSQVLLKHTRKREALAKSKEAFELSKAKDIDITLNYIEVLIANMRHNEAKKLLEKIQVETVEQKEKSMLLTNKL